MVLKKALLIACTYNQTQFEVSQGYESLKEIFDLLTRDLGFHSQQIFTLCDHQDFEPNNKYLLHSGYFEDMLPTKDNIYKGINWLTSNLQEGDITFFYFIGQVKQLKSLRQADQSLDKMDHYIVPVDTYNKIPQEALQDMLVKDLPKGVDLYSLIDANHSGTLLGLQTQLQLRESSLFSCFQATKRKIIGQMECEGFATQLSACKDKQDIDERVGDATRAFCSVLQKYVGMGQQISYIQLMYGMRKELKQISRSKKKEDSFRGSRKQTPILSMSQKVKLGDATKLIILDE